MREVHEMVSAFTCELCPKAFRRKQDLDGHVRAAHTHEKPFECVEMECGAAFARPELLRKHQRKHHAEKWRHRCAVCGVPFLKLRDRQLHQSVCRGSRGRPSVMSSFMESNPRQGMQRHDGMNIRNQSNSSNHSFPFPFQMQGIQGEMGMSRVGGGSFQVEHQFQTAFPFAHSKKVVLEKPH